MLSIRPIFFSFHFKAHPRFLEAASFAWPTASWHFTR